MGIEYDQVNFSQDYELNDHLKKQVSHNPQQTVQCW